MNRLKRTMQCWVALGVCVCFMSTLFPEAYAAIPSVEIAVKTETPKILNIDIPTELATVDEWYQAPAKPKPKLIVHIQDAHANYEAQTRIRDLIKYLNSQYGFKTILVEGAASELDPNILKLFPDQERNLKLVDELAKMGEVTGAEMFLVENSGAAKGVGIEKPSLYRKNFDALQKVYSEDEFVSGFFEAYEAKLGQISSRSFGPRMIQALAEWRKFENGHREFLPFVSKLAELSKKVLDIDLNVLFSQIEWPQLTRLLVLQRVEKELEKTNDQRLPTNAEESDQRSSLSVKAQAELEKQQIIDLLKASKVSEGLIRGLENFDEKSTNLNRIGSAEVRQASAPRALMEALVDEGSKVGFNIRGYPAFAKYAGYLILRSEIVPGELFEEIKKLFDLILEALVKDAPSVEMDDADDLAARKRLLLLHRDEMLARKLLKLELSHNEWLAVLNRQDRFYPDDLNRRMLEQLGQNTRAQAMATEEAAQFKQLNDAFRAAFAFYSAAINRDTYFFQRTQEVLAQTDKAILITGGFHAEGMKYFFRKYDINYGTVTPRITQTFSNEQYRKVMMIGSEEIHASSAELQVVNQAKSLKQKKSVKENYLGAENLIDPARASLVGEQRTQVRWMDTVLKIANSLGLRVRVPTRAKIAGAPERVKVARKKVQVNMLPETGKAGRLRAAMEFLESKGIRDVLIIGSIPRGYLFEKENDGSVPVKGEIDLILRDKKQAAEVSQALGLKIDLINGGVVEFDGWQIDIQGWFTSKERLVIESPNGATRNMLDWPSYSVMAFGLFSNGEWFDPHRGIEDAESRLLRWINPKNTPLTLFNVMRFLGFYHGLALTGKFNIDETSFKNGEEYVRRALNLNGEGRSDNIKAVADFYLFSEKIKTLVKKYLASKDLIRAELFFQILIFALSSHLKNKLLNLKNDLRDRYYAAAFKQITGLLLNTGRLVFMLGRALLRGASSDEVLFRAGILGFNAPIKEMQDINFSDWKLPSDIEDGGFGIAREVKYLMVHAQDPEAALNHLVDLGGQWLLDLAGLDRNRLLEDFKSRGSPEYIIRLVSKYGMARSESREPESLSKLMGEFLSTQDGKQAANGARVAAVSLLTLLGISLFFPGTLPALITYGIAVISFASVAYSLFKGLPAIVRVLKTDKRGDAANNVLAPQISDRLQSLASKSPAVKVTVTPIPVAQEIATFDSLKEELEKAKAGEDFNKRAKAVLGMANLASTVEEIKGTQTEIRAVRSESRKITDESLPSKLIMASAKLAIALDALKKQPIRVTDEVVVTAKALREQIYSGLSDTDRNALRQATFDDWENQVKDAKGLSAAQAVAVLLAYGFIAGNDRDAAKNMAKLASLVVGKVAPEQTSELSEMLRTFFPGMASDLSAPLIQVLTENEWKIQSPFFEIVARLYPNMRMFIYVESNQAVPEEKIGSLIVNQGKDIHKRAKTKASEIVTEMAKDASRGEAFKLLFAYSNQINISKITISNLQIASDEYDRSIEDKNFAAVFGKVRRALLLSNPEMAGQLVSDEMDVDVFEKDNAVWKITDQSLSKALEKLASVFRALSQIKASA